MIRRSLAFAHRWLGLATALFLLPACLTGSALVWKTELDEWLNPQLFQVRGAAGVPLDERALRAALKTQAPAARIVWLELPRSPGHTVLASVANWPDPADAGRRINEVFLDPATGAIQGARSTVTPGLTRPEFMHWLRRFHYTLAMKRSGMLLMGGVAIAWLMNSLVGMVLTVPSGANRLRRWLRTWKVRRQQLNYDLHRATSLWLWPALIVLSSTSIYLNLAREVYVPALESLARLLPAARRADAVNRVLEWQEPLHTGAAFGLAGRLIVFVTGIAAVLGLCTGLLSWTRRLARQRSVTDR